MVLVVSMYLKRVHIKQDCTLSSISTVQVHHLHAYACSRIDSIGGGVALIVIDICFQEGLVYAVEFSHRSGRDLINVAKKRTNIIPIIEDARHPHKYRMLVGELRCASIINV